MHFLLKIFCLFIISVNINAAPASVDVPESLQKWRSWVLAGHPELACSSGVKGNQRQCVWLSQLEIESSRHQTLFSQHALIEKTSWISLPGEAGAWPERVKVNGLAAPVIMRKGQPALLLEKGQYSISGAIIHTKAPIDLKLSPETTFVKLILDMQLVAQPSIANHRLLLNVTPKKIVKSSDSLKLQVFRLLKDGYPLTLETQLDLNVAGDTRLTRLSRVIPEGFEISSIRSKLALRINDDGTADIQLKPGRHVVYIKAHILAADNQFYNQKSQVFSMEQGENWPAQEIWALVQDRAVRIVDVKGAAIDVNQTNMPRGWKQYSSYLLTPKQGLKLVQKSRGDVSPNTNDLTLKRQLWLDFDGAGFTANDALTGKVGQLSRLSANVGYSTGKVTINQQPILVTSINGDQGVQLLPGKANIESLGRVERGAISVSPWLSEVNQVRVEINLPPGYSIFSAQGASSVSNDYLSSWQLWEIFIVILLVAFLFKQYSLSAALTGLAYALAIHNVTDAPSILLLLVVLGLHSIVRQLPVNKWSKRVVYGYQFSLVIVMLSFLPFAVQQARLAIYPQLEKNSRIMTHKATLDEMQFDRGAQMQSQELERMVQVPQKMSSVVRSAPSFNKTREPIKQYESDYQENEIVQTGPGLPNWQWNKVRLHFAGPVVQEQQFTLIVMPPALNRFLNVLRIILFIALGFFLMRTNLFTGFTRYANKNSQKTVAQAGSDKESPTKGEGGFVKLKLLVWVLILCSSAMTAHFSVASEFPDQALLDEYFERLNAPQKCEPDCLGLSSLKIKATDQSIVLDMKVVALAKSPFQLPVNLNKLTSATILVDDQITPFYMKHKGRAYLQLEAGEHRISMTINALSLSQMALAFNELPQAVTFSSDIWRVLGIENGRLTQGSLVLRRLKKQQDDSAKTQLAPLPIAPLVRVDRVIKFDVDWSIETTVSRIAPLRGAMSVSVDLLDGEFVISDKVLVKGNKAQLNFSINMPSISYRSDLKRQSVLELIAAESVNSYETWQLQPSHKWHITHRGVLPVKTADARLLWRPLPGDTLSLAIEKPVAIEGMSFAIDQVDLIHEVAKARSKTTLMMAFRASRGSDYPLKLPADAKVSKVSLNGRDIIFTQENEQVLLPVPSGSARFVVEWTQPQSLSLVTHTPTLELANASNVNLATILPANRWVLAVSGPLIGPAILFWGVLLLIIGAGFCLGRMPWSPLKSWQWMLLGAGIATSFWPITLLVVLWFVLLAKRSSLINDASLSWRYNALQIVIGGCSAIMILALVGSVAQSLIFGAPDMQVTGNGSYATSMNWYQDLVIKYLPETSVVSVPMWSYQILMLLWSIWLSVSLIAWLQWGWQKFSENGVYKAAPKKKQVADDAA